MGAPQQLLASFGGAPLEFDIDQATRGGSCNSMGGSCNAESTLATTTTSGGETPYTYQWSFVSGDSFPINTPTASSTKWNKTNPVAGNPAFVGVYKCVVTDGLTNTAEDTVQVTLTFIDTT